MTPVILTQKYSLDKKLSKTSWTNFKKLFRIVALSNSKYAEGLQLLDLLSNDRLQECFELIEYLSDQLYTDPAHYFAVTQFCYLLKKYDFPQEINPFDPEAVAIRKFLSAERKCSVVNKSFLQKEILKDPFVSSNLWRMRAWISNVLGPFPGLTEVYNQSDMGPGASIGVHGNCTNRARKLNSRWSVSPEAFHYGRAMMLSDPHVFELLSSERWGKHFVCYEPEEVRKRFDERVDVVNYNKIAFVPKTAQTYRSIAVEPLLNSMLQKGVDKIMRVRLRRIGIDLSDQSRNSELARQGSLDTENGYCTIDLSSASDSISIGLVQYLLPPDWFDFLNSIRSMNYKMDGKYHRYSKFCSMGNGFCFPLETLLFASACASVGSKRGDFAVYGDDIIVRKSEAVDLVLLLQGIGFDTNTEKTFLSGPFRESCGADWWHGQDVRPYILDHRLDTLEAIFKAYNLMARSERTKMFFHEARKFLWNLVPLKLRLCRPFWGPVDTCFTVPLDSFMSSPFADWNKSYQCWKWLELVHSPCRDDIKDVEYQGITLLYGVMRGSRSALPFAIRRKTRTKTRFVSGSGDREEAESERTGNGALVSQLAPDFRG